MATLMQRRGRAAALQEIERSPAHKAWLEHMRNEESVLNSRIDRKESKLSAAKDEIYQLLGLFFVVQGVILTAIAQPQALQCRHWWSPFALSLLASIATLAALLRKLADLRVFQQQLLDDKRRSKALFEYIRLILEQGASFDLDSEPGQGTDRNHRAASRVRKEQADFIGHKFAILTVLVLFAVIILASCVVILCHPLEVFLGQSLQEISNRVGFDFTSYYTIAPKEGESLCDSS